MAEGMREVTEAAVLEGVASLYPGVRKVTVDMAGGVGYVFVGRGNWAVTVTGAEFDALVEMLSPAVDDADDVDDVGRGAADAAPADGAVAPKVKRGKAA